MKVIVVPYDLSWPLAFKRTSAEVSPAFCPGLLELHHIGSTSIPGIHAKPIIDMLAVVADIGAVDGRDAELRSLGYDARGELGIPGRRYFSRNDSAGVRTHQIHAFQVGSPHVHRHLVFRDYLRARPEVAREYSDLKRRLAAAHPDDIEAYMDGKDGFIKAAEADALVWRAHEDLFKLLDEADWLQVGEHRRVLVPRFERARDVLKQGEYHLAFEFLVENLYEFDTAISESLLSRIRAVGDAIGVERGRYAFLDELVGGQT